MLNQALRRLSLFLLLLTCACGSKSSSEDTPRNNTIPEAPTEEDEPELTKVCDDTFPECPEHSECVETSEQAVCRCSAGFAPDKDGVCEVIDECALGVLVCEKGEICETEAGTSSCRPGSDAELAAAAAEQLSIESLLGANLSPDHILTALSLPLVGAQGTTITWESNHPDVVGVDGEVLRPLEGDREVTLTATFKYGDGSSQRTFKFVVIEQATLVSVQISPAVLRLPADSTQQLQAWAYYSDGTSQVVTHQASWASSVVDIQVGDDPAYDGNWFSARTSGALAEGYLPKGLVSRLFGHSATGSATITVTFAGESGEAALVVTDGILESIAIDEVAAIPLNGSRQLVARGVFLEDETSTTERMRDVIWTSSAPAIISVSPEGTATALGAGSATITVTSADGGVASDRLVTVDNREVESIQIEVARDGLFVGTSVLVQVLGRLGDGTHINLTEQAELSAGEPSVAEVVLATDDDTGLSQAYLSLKSGGETGLSAQITSASGAVLQAKLDLLVQNLVPVSLRLEPPTATIPEGDRVEFRVIAKYSDDQERVLESPTLSVGDTEVLGLDSVPGRVLGLKSGTAQVHARLAGLSAEAQVIVSDGLESMWLERLDLLGDEYVGSVASFIVKASFDSGLLTPLPSSGVDWSIDGQDPEAPVARHLGQGKFSLLAPGDITIVAVRRHTDGTVHRMTLGLTVEEDVVESLVVDPAGLSDTLDEDYPSGSLHDLQFQPFRIYAQRASGRRTEVSDQVTTVVTVREELRAPDSGLLPAPHLVSGPEALLEGRFAAFPAYVPGTPFQVLRFYRPEGVVGTYDVQFQYGGLSATSTVRFLLPEVVFDMTASVPTGPITFSDPPVTIRVGSIDDLFIKESNPKYKDALIAFVEEVRADLGPPRDAVEVIDELGIELDSEVRDALAEELLNEDTRLRSALVDRFTELAVKNERTEEEELLVEWLELRVKGARVATAVGALSEYEKWDADPWSYEAPGGLPYSPPVHPPKSSFWLFTTPSPPPNLRELGVASHAENLAIAGAVSHLAVAALVGVPAGSAAVSLMSTTTVAGYAIASGSAGVAGAGVAAAGGAVAVVVVAATIAAIEGVSVFENAELPAELAREIEAQRLRPAPDARVLVLHESGAAEIMNTVIAATYAELGCDQGEGAGCGCYADHECAEGSQCGPRGTCVDCARHSGCAPDEWCDTQVFACENDHSPGDFCGVPWQCPGDLCADSTCLCSEDADCDGITRCNNEGACVTCVEDDDCPSGFCSAADYTCRPCLAGKGCAASEYCNLDDFTCDPKLTLGQNCLLGIDCVSGHCGLGDSGLVCECDGDEDCGGDSCNETTGECYECVVDEECEGDEYCRQSDLTCALKLSIGGSCNSGSQCESGTCADVGGSLECVCDSNADCAGEYCSTDSECVPCVPGEGCSGGEYCRLPDYSCQMVLSLGETCLLGSDCSSGYCGPGDSGLVCECNGDEDCGGDSCNETTGECYECAVDGDCGGDEYCRQSDLSCAPKLSIGGGCLSGSQCESGTCADVDGSLECVCDSHSDCAGEYCSSGNECVPCVPGEGCSGGEYCRLADFSCQPRAVIGEGCFDDSECASDACELVDATLECVCDDHADCGSEYCDPSSGQCETCVPGSGCAGDEYCRISDFSCQDKLAVGELCNVASECDTNSCGLSGGVQVCLCTGDSDCPASDHCDEICVDDLALGENCSRDAMCASGNCVELGPGLVICQ